MLDSKFRCTVEGPICLAFEGKETFKKYYVYNIGIKNGIFTGEVFKKNI